VQISQETGRLNAMDLMEVNPALAKTEAEAGRCGGPFPANIFTKMSRSITYW
jgi:hypothetical protein